MLMLLHNNKLEEIIIGLPQDLLSEMDKLYLAIIPQEIVNLDPYFDLKTKISRQTTYPNLYSFFEDIKSIFDYDDFIGLKANEPYNSYRLAMLLNMRSCTYCNRVFTTTMVTKDKEKIMRPQFDHWYPKYRFPLFVISFYNLIPSCNSCNSSAKGDSVLDLRLNVHPYIDKNQTDDFAFDYFYSGLLDKYRIFVKKTNLSNSKAFDTVKILRIDEMYNSHHEELDDLIKLKQAYSDNYINSINDFFPNSHLSKSTIYKLLHGVEFDSNKFHNKPMSKFKKDILKKLEMID